MNNTDRAIIKKLSELERSTLSELRKKTGYNKDWIWERLQVLLEGGIVEKKNRGLYNLTSKGKSKLKQIGDKGENKK